MKNLWVIGAVVLVVIVAGGLWLGIKRSAEVQPGGVTASPAASGEQVPDLTLTNYEGNTVRLADFTGKPRVINSWAAWCPFCVKELTDFATVQKEFGDRVVMVAIDRAETREVAREFTDQLGISQDLVFLLDPNDSFYQAIGGFSMPETLFVKADGTIHFHKRGPMTVDEIRQRTQELMP